MDKGEMDTNQSESDPKKIISENKSADLEKEDFQFRKPQPPGRRTSCHKCPEKFGTPILESYFETQEKLAEHVKSVHLIDANRDEKDNYQSDPKRIKLENESADVKLEDSQKWTQHNLSCHKCPEGFGTSEEIIHHWSEAHGLHPANCTVCNDHFPTVIEMWDHKVAIHGIPCELCDSLFETEEKLTDHVKSVHLNILEENGEQNFNDAKDHQDVKPAEYIKDNTGADLDLPTNNKSGLETIPPNSQSQIVNTNCNAHSPTIKDMWDEKVSIHGIPCELCESFFKTEEKLTEHVKLVHLNETNLEENGEQNFNDAKDHQDVKPTVYSECTTRMAPNLPTNSKNGLENVNTNSKAPVSADPSLTFTCHLCPENFQTVLQLKGHWSVAHNLPKLVHCGVCAKLFTCRKLKYEHKIAAHGITCEICSKNFKTKKGLGDHAKEVHGVKQNCCTVCGLGFTKELKLKKHVFDSHSNVPGAIQRCNTCRFYCLTEEEMTKHKGIHVSTKCSVCEMVFPSNGAALRHLRTKHPVLL